jgi:hypothetical protein
MEHLMSHSISLLCSAQLSLTFTLFEETGVPHVGVEFADVNEVVDAALDVRHGGLYSNNNKEREIGRV